jgi:hypothetical protein
MCPASEQEMLSLDSRTSAPHILICAIPFDHALQRLDGLGAKQHLAAMPRWPIDGGRRVVQLTGNHAQARSAAMLSLSLSL